MSEARTLLEALAKKLRSRVEWQCRDGYYTTETEGLVNRAIRDALEGVAQDIEDLLLQEMPS